MTLGKPNNGLTSFNKIHNFMPVHKFLAIFSKLKKVHGSSLPLIWDFITWEALAEEHGYIIPIKRSSILDVIDSDRLLTYGRGQQVDVLSR